MNNIKNIAIIEGGYSHEKIISLQSAETIFNNIDRTLYNPIKVRIDEKGWVAYDGKDRVKMDLSDFSFVIGAGNIPSLYKIITGIFSSFAILKNSC